MQILEDECQRPLPRRELQSAADAPVQLGLCDPSGAIRAAWGGWDADQIGQRGCDRPQLVAIVRVERVEEQVELAGDHVAGVALEDSGRRLEELRNRPI